MDRLQSLGEVKAKATNGNSPFRGDHMGSNDVWNWYFSQFKLVRCASIITSRMCCVCVKDVVISESGC